MVFLLQDICYVNIMEFCVKMHPKIINLGISVYKLIVFLILESLITIVGFVIIHYSITILTQQNSLNLKVQIILFFAAIGIAYLSIVNFFWWLMGINLLDLKKCTQK